MVDSADVIRQIESVRFTPVRMREGYDMGEVDAFLDSLTRAAREGTPFGPLVAAATFSTVRLREGYDISDVDAFLERVAQLHPVPDERASRERAASPAARALAGRIRGARLPTALLREGYATAEVDELLDELAAAALEERSLRPLIDSAAFERVRFGRGYVPEKVDEFLAALAAG